MKMTRLFFFVLVACFTLANLSCGSSGSSSSTTTTTGTTTTSTSENNASEALTTDALTISTTVPSN